MDHGFVRWDNDFSVSIKLHFNLLIDKEDVMHFLYQNQDRLH